jgi:hypothetical protein
MSDIPVPHLKSMFDLNYSQATLIQVAFFSAYLLFSIPWSRFVKLVLCTSAAGGAGDDFNDIGRSRGESLHASGRILLAAENCSELHLQGQLDRARAPIW